MNDRGTEEHGELSTYAAKKEDAEAVHARCLATFGVEELVYIDGMRVCIAPPSYVINERYERRSDWEALVPLVLKTPKMFIRVCKGLEFNFHALISRTPEDIPSSCSIDVYAYYCEDLT